MRGTVVTGRFVDQNDQPIKGVIKFVPSRLWVEHDGQAWATQHHELTLDEEGGFTVILTPTYGHDNFRWHYTVHCPMGAWTVQVPETPDVVQIKSLLPSRFHK